jgi:hypothetical protein
MNPEPPPLPEPKPVRNPGPYVWLCISLAIASVLYRILVLGHVEQTSLMFIGLPTALALMLAFLPRAKSATGTIMRGITMFLLALGILLIEGFICILMAAPFFYSIGIIVGIFVDKARAQREWEKRFRLVMLPALALMSLEGVTGILSFPREESVTVVHEVNLSPTEARELLAKGPNFDVDALPAFLKLGFPMPKSIAGNGLNMGDQWRIHFAGGEGKPGDLLAEVTSSTEEHIIVSCISDTSHIAHWLDWHAAEWKLEAVGEGTRITLTMHYSRLLDPAWYFKPIERYGVEKAGEYFLQQTFPNE